MPWKRILPLLLAAHLAGGCERPKVSPGVHEEHSGHDDGDREAGRVVVDPALVDSGRIELYESTAQEGGADLWVPAEVVSDPEGEALVGSLVSGRVRTLSADIGDEVDKGQVLAVVNAPEVAKARARLAQVSAQLALAESQFGRQKQLKSSEATSQRALDQAEAGVKGAQAELESIRALLTSWGANSGGSVSAQLPIRSPISGFVAKRTATLGGAVRPDETLFHVVAPDRIVVLARWPEARLAVPERGSLLEVRPRTSSGSAECMARVETRGQIVDPSTRTVTLRLRPEASCPALLPGSFANVAAKGHGKNKEPLIPADADGAPVTSPDDGVTTSVGAAVEIPRLSVVDVRGVPTVFVATSEKGHFQARRVATRPSHGDLVIVESGLRPKEKVVSKGVILLKGELLGDSLGGH